MSQQQSLPARAKSAESRPTTPFSEPWLAKLRNAIGSVNGRPTMMSGCSITPAERSRIEGLARQHRERLAVGPDDRRAIVVILAKLLAAFPAQSQSDGPAEQRAEAYMEALAGIPAWVVEDARKAVIAGMAAECVGKWAPTPPQLAAVCRRLMKPHTDTIRDLERILAATGDVEPNERERERVAAGFDKLKSDLLGSSHPSG